jgi:hypothetical protein
MLFAAAAGLKPTVRAQNARMSTPEPGLDRHEWETELQALEPELADGPAEALPELQNLVERMLAERGFAPDDPIVSDGDEPEVIAEFRAATETVRALERGDDVDPGDIAAAVNGLRAVFDYLVSARSAP